MLYFGSDRFDNSGDAQQGFWFFQNKITLDLATGKFVGVHKTGDLLILSDFSNGGQVSTINIYRWTGDDATGSLDLPDRRGGIWQRRRGSPDAFCGIVEPGQRHYVAVVLHRQERQPHVPQRRVLRGWRQPQRSFDQPGWRVLLELRRRRHGRPPRRPPR